MSAHSVREDDSAVSRADRAFHTVERATNLAAGLIVLGVMLMAVANILGRKFFNLPVPGYIDWMEQAVPAMAVISVAYCQRLGGHIRMDFLVGKLSGRALWLFELLSVILMLIITAALIYGSWDHAARAINIGDSTVDINLPTWPAKILFPIAFGLLAIRLTLQIWAYWLALKSGAEHPVAVPLIEDPATQALNEARTVSGHADDQESVR